MTTPLTAFTITPNHLTLLRHAYVRWDKGEYGAPGIDPKRPYGNGDVEKDILTILGETMDAEYDDEPDYSAWLRSVARHLHKEMGTVLQICLCTGSFRAGVYYKKEPYNARSWEPAQENIL